jgi:predicted DNA-binding protein (MmcQ/YjbR family)
VNAGALREHCLSFTGASETFLFGPKVSVFKVSGKMFALSRLDQVPLRVSLKCEPGLAEQLRDTHAAVLPGYHLNKRHWNTVIVDGSLTDRMIKDMIEDVGVFHSLQPPDELLHCYAVNLPCTFAGLLATASTNVFNSGLGLPSYPAARIQVSMSCNFG